jgi:hypothetical protein
MIYFYKDVSHKKTSDVSPFSTSTMNKSIAGEGFIFQQPSTVFQPASFTRFYHYDLFGQLKGEMKE